MINKSTGNFLNSKSGLTIIEVVVAVFILTIVAFGTVAGLLQARRATEGSIYLGTANTIAQGYIEQIKNMDFDLLDESVLTELINQGQADTLSVSPLAADPEVGGASDIPNVKSIDINNTPDNANDDLVMSFVLYIDDITDASAGIADARRIILRYNYADGSSGSNKTISNIIYTARSNIPTF